MRTYGVVQVNGVPTIYEEEGGMSLGAAFRRAKLLAGWVIPGARGDGLRARSATDAPRCTTCGRLTLHLWTGECVAGCGP